MRAVLPAPAADNGNTAARVRVGREAETTGSKWRRQQLMLPPPKQTSQRAAVGSRLQISQNPAATLRRLQLPCCAAAQLLSPCLPRAPVRGYTA